MFSVRIVFLITFASLFKGYMKFKCFYFIWLDTVERGQEIINQLG